MLPQWIVTKLVLLLALLSTATSAPAAISSHVNDDSSNTAASARLSRRVFDSPAWAGAVLPPQFAGSFSSVSATFNIPYIAQPAGNSGTHGACAWVGLDGAQSTSGILQAGCDFYSHTDLPSTYGCWTEWYPAPMVDIQDFHPSQGDEITVSINLLTDTLGTATLTNKGTGQSVTQVVSAPNPQATIAGLNAEFIVEDYAASGALIPLTNFCPVTLRNCTAGTASGHAFNLASADPMEIYNFTTQNIMASATILDPTEVRVERWNDEGFGLIQC